MKEEKKEYYPPVCPVCGNPLYQVNEDVLELYEFDADTGKYREVQEAGTTGTIAIYCPHCENDLSELFPEGVCNYE